MALIEILLPGYAVRKSELPQPDRIRRSLHRAAQRHVRQFFAIPQTWSQALRRRIDHIHADADRLITNEHEDNRLCTARNSIERNNAVRNLGIHMFGLKR